MRVRVAQLARQPRANDAGSDRTARLLGIIRGLNEAASLEPQAGDALIQLLTLLSGERAVLALAEPGASFDPEAPAWMITRSSSGPGRPSAHVDGDTLGKTGAGPALPLSVLALPLKIHGRVSGMLSMSAAAAEAVVGAMTVAYARRSSADDANRAASADDANRAAGANARSREVDALIAIAGIAGGSDPLDEKAAKIVEAAASFVGADAVALRVPDEQG